MKDIACTGQGFSMLAGILKNETVKRNIERFPLEFCFQLSNKEYDVLKSQNVTSSLKKENYGGRRYLPYIFTE